VEEGAMLKGGVEVRTSEKKAQPQNQTKHEQKPEPPKSLAATAGA